MSENVRSYGYMAVLVTPLNSEQREEILDKLHDYRSKNPLMINYEGTLVYTDYNKVKAYRERSNIYGLNLGKDATEMESADAFIVRTNNEDLAAEASTVHPYNCIWYNGADSDMSSLTKDEFLRRISGS
jgi:hypothetical protein